MEKHFCTCTDTECPFNPNNPATINQKCDLCIKKCLGAKEIPACFFKDIHKDTSSQKDYTYGGFCDYYAKHSDHEPMESQPYAAMKERMGAFIRGELDSAQLKPHFAPSGIYEQRNGAFMVRIRITGGHLPVATLNGIADFMKTLNISYAHLSSRQDIQLHDVPAEKVHDVMLACDSLELPFKGGGGDTFRNIAVTADSGFAPKQAFNVMPYAIELNEAMRHCEKAYALPRKLKIGYFTGEQGEFLAAQQDLGFAAEVRNGQRGFKVYGGGGMGRESSLGIVLMDFIPADQHVRCAFAMTALFDAHGNRENRHKARIRFILKERGEDGFRALFQQYFKDSAQQENAIKREEPAATALRCEKRKLAPITPDPGFETWRAHAASPDAMAGYSSVRLYVPYGNLNGDQLQRVAKLASDAGCAFVRLTRDQDILLPGVWNGALPALHRALMEDFPDLDLALKSFKGHITSCVGSAVCKIGILPAPELSDRIAMAADSLLPADTEEKLAKLRLLTTQLRISGCPNCCAGHPAAKIGIQGQKKQIDGRSEDVGVFLTGASKENMQLSTINPDIPPATMDELPGRVMGLL